MKNVLRVISILCCLAMLFFVPLNGFAQSGGEEEREVCNCEQKKGELLEKILQLYGAVFELEEQILQKQNELARLEREYKFPPIQVGEAQIQATRQAYELAIKRLQKEIEELKSGRSFLLEEIGELARKIQQIVCQCGSSEEVLNEGK